MSKPEAGQWWFTNDGSERCYIIGFSTDGEVVVEYEESRMDSDDGDWGKWHHEPRCTGWDWVVPEEPVATPSSTENPDKLVVQDRVPVRVGVDEIHWSDWHADRWEVAFGHWYQETRHGSTFDGAVVSVRCRRRDLPPVAQTEQWPKYYRPSQQCRTVNHDKPVAFFKMLGVDDGETFHTDGTSFRWSEWVSGLATIEITEAEAMALLKKPKQAEVAPLTNQQVDDLVWAIDEAIRKSRIATPDDIREIIAGTV